MFRATPGDAAAPGLFNLRPFPYVVFGALATLDGLLRSRPYVFIVSGALFAFAFLIWKASDPRETQSDRDWLFAALGWDPTWQQRLPPRTRSAWIAAVSLVAGAFCTLAVLAAYYMPKERPTLDEPPLYH